jgi:hypothetical protein
MLREALGLRERLWAHLLAWYRACLHANGLLACQRARAVLIRELDGIAVPVPGSRKSRAGGTARCCMATAVSSDSGDAGAAEARSDATGAAWRRLRCDSGGGALMEEWVVAGLLGVVAGYGVRVWQEKTPAVVKRPAEAVVRTIGSAAGAGASMGGRAAGAGASLGARAVRGGVATMVSGAGVASRTATRRSGGGRSKTMTRVPVSGGRRGATPSRARPARPRSRASGAASKQTPRTSSRSRSRRS